MCLVKPIARCYTSRSSIIRTYVLLYNAIALTSAPNPPADHRYDLDHGAVIDASQFDRQSACVALAASFDHHRARSAGAASPTTAAGRDRRHTAPYRPV